MRSCINLLGAAVVVCLTWAIPSLCGNELALDFRNTSTAFLYANAAGENALGWSFTTSQSYYATALGLFDYGGDGLGEPAPVTLWQVGAGALASVVVTSSSDPVPSVDANGRWLFEPITPVHLSPGKYVMGVYYASSDPQNRGGLDFVNNSQRLEIAMAPGLTYGGYRFNNGGTFPGGEIATDSGFFGPNLLLVVPEPHAAWMIVGALAGMVRLRREVRRQRKFVLE